MSEISNDDANKQAPKQEKKPLREQKEIEVDLSSPETPMEFEAAQETVQRLSEEYRNQAKEETGDFLMSMSEQMEHVQKTYDETLQPEEKKATEELTDRAKAMEKRVDERLREQDKEWLKNLDKAFTAPLQPKPKNEAAPQRTFTPEEQKQILEAVSPVIVNLPPEWRKSVLDNYKYADETSFGGVASKGLEANGVVRLGYKDGTIVEVWPNGQKRSNRPKETGMEAIPELPANAQAAERMEQPMETSAKEKNEAAVEDIALQPLLTLEDWLVKDQEAMAKVQMAAQSPATFEMRETLQARIKATENLIKKRNTPDALREEVDLLKRMIGFEEGNLRKSPEEKKAEIIGRIDAAASGVRKLEQRIADAVAKGDRVRVVAENPLVDSSPDVPLLDLEHDIGVAEQQLQALDPSAPESGPRRKELETKIDDFAEAVRRRSTPEGMEKEIAGMETIVTELYGRMGSAPEADKPMLANMLDRAQGQVRVLQGRLKKMREEAPAPATMRSTEGLTMEERVNASLKAEEETVEVANEDILEIDGVSQGPAKLDSAEDAAPVTLRSSEVAAERDQTAETVPVKKTGTAAESGEKKAETRETAKETVQKFREALKEKMGIFAAKIAALPQERRNDQNAVDMALKAFGEEIGGEGSEFGRLMEAAYDADLQEAEVAWAEALSDGLSGAGEDVKMDTFRRLTDNGPRAALAAMDRAAFTNEQRQKFVLNFAKRSGQRAVEMFPEIAATIDKAALDEAINGPAMQAPPSKAA